MDQQQLKRLIRVQFPHCPGMYVEDIAERLERRGILPGLERKEIDAMAAAVIRHQLTDYDRLRTTHDLAPEEAEAIVADEISDWLGTWRVDISRDGPGKS